MLQEVGSSVDDELSALELCGCTTGALGPGIPHVQEERTMGLVDLTAVLQLIEPAFADPDWVTTAEGQTPEIEQKHRQFSKYYAEFQVIAADVNWNLSTLRNNRKMRLSEEMKHSFQYREMPNELPVCVAMCRMQHNQI